MSLFDDDMIYDGDERDTDDVREQPATTSKLSPPQANPLKFGHEKQEKLFLELFDKGTMPHALIFAGPEGIGKTTMAFRLARFLLKYGTPQDTTQDSLFAETPLKPSTLDIHANDPIFTRVASGGHPDFRYIERAFDPEKGRQESGLRIEAVRKIEPFLRMKSSNGGWRVVIVEDADTMNRNAQNAILKILEEPPPNVIMILIAHRAGALIPTIRSRARRVAFEPLEDSVMRDLLRRQGYAFDKAEMDLLLHISGGSIGRAIKLAEEGGLTILRMIADEIGGSDFPNWVSIHTMAQELGAAAQDKEYRLFADMIQWIFRRRAVITAKGERPFTPLDKVLPNASAQKMLGISDELKKLFDRTDFSNLDRREAVRAAFLVISQ